MREVESEDGSLAALGPGVSKLTLGKSSSVGNLRSMRDLRLTVACDLHRWENTVKKFLMADLVVYHAPLSFLHVRVAGIS